MDLRSALTAALELLADAPVASIIVDARFLRVSVLDPAERRTIADELGADSGTLNPSNGIVTHTAIVATDGGELTVEVFGKPDAEDWRRYDEDARTATLAARPVTA